MTKNWILHKNVLITGTSSGIGFELAKLLSSECFCNVFGCGRNLEKLERSKKIIDEEIEKYHEKLSMKNKQKHEKGTYEFLQTDVSSFEKFSELKQKLDEVGFRVDVVICNAGIMPAFERFETQSVETAKKVFETNFFSQVYAYKLFCEDLKQNHGAFFSISSSSALCPVVGEALYSASKSAIKNFIESIRVEHRKDFLVGIVFPGYVDTDLFREQQNLSRLVKSFSMKSEKMARKIVRRIQKRKRRSVIGFDAKLMNGMYKFFPKTTPGTIANVLASVHDPMFDKVFENNQREKKKK